MARYSFTINHMRTTLEFKKYRELIDAGLFQGVEIFYPYQYLLSNELDKFDLYTKNVYELLEGTDIEVVLHLPFGGELNDLMKEDNSDAMQRMFDAMDYANKFGAKKLTLHLGSTKGYLVNEYLNKSIDNVSKLCDYAKKYNQVVMIENMPGSNEVASTLDEMKYILDSLNYKGYNAKLIYDTGHGHVAMKDIEKECEFLRELKPYLYHFHINDNDSTRDQHARIGLGNVRFKELFEGIKEDYKELYTLEILFRSSDDLICYQNDLANILEK